MHTLKETLKKAFFITLMLSAIPFYFASALDLPSSLPVASTYASNVDNPKGTAILIPQIHRYPGSNVTDPLNDNAESAQKEAYQIMSYLTQNDNINLIMAEGDLYGPVSQEKINNLAQEINLRNLLAQFNFTSLVNLLDRDIFLAGAPYILKAKNNDINLYGGETESVYNESANIVRNYVYLTDRKTQLENGIRTTTSPLALKSNTSLPSRENNPYESINSVSQIDSLIQQSENQIQNVVVDERNKEAAKNFAKALQENKETTGIIQFGEGHEEGLVKELNNAGISVIVIKSK